MNVLQRSSAHAAEADTAVDGWDGYGAAAVSPTVWANARALATPEMTPTTHGTVTLVWTIGDTEVVLDVGAESYSMIVTKTDGDTVRAVAIGSAKL